MESEPQKNDDKGHNHTEEQHANPLIKLFNLLLEWGTIWGLVVLAVVIIYPFVSSSPRVIYVGALCLSVSAFLASHKLWRKWSAIKRYSIPIGLTFLLCVAANWSVAKIEGQSGLKLFLLAPRFPAFTLELTRDGIIDSSQGDEFKAEWTLVIPVLARDEATLRFMLFNNSATKNIDGYEVSLAFSDDLAVSPGAIAPLGDWEYGAVSRTDFKALLSKRLRKIFPRNRNGISDVGLRPIGSWSVPPKQRLVFITLSIEGSPPVKIGLKLACPISSVPKAPYLLPPGRAPEYEVKPIGG